MYQTVSESDFHDAFHYVRREENFSYEGRKALFNYLEEYEENGGEEIELDAIALCCDFAEFDDVPDFIDNYGALKDEWLECLEDACHDGQEASKAFMDILQEHTFVISVNYEGFIIQRF
jgi:hypothetical protein